MQTAINMAVSWRSGGTLGPFLEHCHVSNERSLCAGGGVPDRCLLPRSTCTSTSVSSEIDTDKVNSYNHGG